MELIFLNEGFLGITIKIMMEFLATMFCGNQRLCLFGSASKNLDEIENGFFRAVHLYLVFKLQGKDGALQRAGVRKDFPTNCSFFP